jgi:exodeoxyribonuclease VII small subunit
MKSEAQSLERTLHRLEAIVTGLEREDLDLEEALRLFEEGVQRLREAQQILSVAELKVERLVEESGEPQLEPMPSEKA